MTYFNSFPLVSYRFGDEANPDVFQNISVYADVLDQVANSVTFYSDYFILPGERPDQVSYKLYGNTQYHWTFFLVNPNLRESGWPLAPNKVFEKAKADYFREVLTTKTPLTDKFKIGQTVSGLSSAASGKIIHRNLDLGQLTLDNLSGSFTDGETVSSTNSDGVVETITLTSSSEEYNAPLFYQNASKEVVDIDPAVGPGSTLVPVTRLDNLNNINDAARSIKVLKKDIVKSVVDSFYEAVRL